VKTELPSLYRKFENNAHFSCQQNAWCDKAAFMDWIEFIWKPFTELKCPLPTLLILDQYKVHRQDKVLERLANLGTLVIHLPLGETSQLQALDVGVNKQFKDYIRNSVREHNAEIGRFKIASFIVSAWQQISQQSIINTFQHIRFIR
jgi:hypothetical protein